MRRSWLRAGALGGLSVQAMLITGSVRAESPPVLPAVTGQPLAVRICGQCHSVELVMRHRMTRRQWMAQIDTMIAKGAKVEEEEFDALADYLAEALGPEALSP